MVTITVSLAVLGGMALAAQDRLTLKVPNGPAFTSRQRIRKLAECRQFCQTEHGSLESDRGKYRDDGRISERHPGNGKHFPDGSKIVKIEWSPKKNPEFPWIS